MNPWTIFRIAAILLGIASATLMAVDDFKVSVNQAFMEVLEGVREVVGTIVWPLELLIVMPIVNWLHEQGFVFEFHDHWKNTFVLLWLFFGAFARMLSSSRQQGNAAFSALWGALVALGACAATGFVAFDSEALLFWPLAGFVLFVAGQVAFDAIFDHRDRAPYFLKAFPVVLLLGVSGIFAFSVRGSIEPFLFAPLPSPGLAFWASAVTILALLGLLFGAGGRNGHGDTGLQRFINDPMTRMGLDILAVLGGATAIVYVAHLLA